MIFSDRCSFLHGSAVCHAKPIAIATLNSSTTVFFAAVDFCCGS